MPNPLPKEHKDGTIVWRVRFTHRGKSRSETFPTQKRAQWFCEQIAMGGATYALKVYEDWLDSQGMVEREDAPTVDAVAEQFFEWKAPRLRSEDSLKDYKTHYRLYIQPTFGHRPVDLVTPMDISKWVDEMVGGQIANARTGKTLSPKTVRDRHALLSQIMSWAANPARKIIDVSPCDQAAELPKRIKGMGKAMQPAEYQALHRALIDTGSPDAADLAAFMLGSGWRIGEAMALNVANVEDYGYGRLMHVTMNRTAHQGQGETVIEEASGKTQSAIRRISLDPDTADVVRRRCEGKRHDELVFQNKGEPWQHHNFRAALDRACAHANLRHITSHWFRHTHVTWMAYNGANLTELQRRIGHASIQTTIDVYGSTIGDVKEDALAGFSSMRDMSIRKIEPLTPNTAIAGVVVDAAPQLAS